MELSPLRAAIEWHPVTFELAVQMHKRIQAQGMRETYIGLQDIQVVASLDCEISCGSTWISIWVTPSRRRQGIGLQSLEFARNWAIQHAAPTPRGSVDPDNRASLGLLKSAQFNVDSHPDGDGLLTNQRHNARWRDQFLYRFGPRHAAVSLLKASQA